MGEDTSTSNLNAGSSDYIGCVVDRSENVSFSDKMKKTLLPVLSVDRQMLKTMVKGAVDATNNVLGSLEQKYDCATTWVNSHIKPLVAQGQDLGQKTLVLYEQRRLYGPQIIGASIATAALFAGIKTRGRLLPSLLVSGFVGGLVSTGIYGVPPWFGNVTQYRIQRKQDE